MHFTDLFVDTVRTLWSHKLRTLLTMFGIAWGIVSITLMVAAGEGLRVGQQQQAQNLGKDLMIVWGGTTSMQAGGVRAGRKVRWVMEDADVVQAQASSCKYALPELGQGNTPVRSSHNSASLLVTGSYPPFEQLRSMTVDKGRFYNAEDLHQRRRVAFIGSDAKKQLFGDREAVGETIHIGSYPYRIVGVMAFKEQDSSYDGRDVSKIFVPITTLLQDFPEKPPLSAHSVENLLVAPLTIADHDDCKRQLRATLGRLHSFDPLDKEACHIWDTMEEARAFRQLTDGMKYFLGAMGVTTLLLGGLGVMNVMLVAVRERTREIGVRKAVGATSRSILGQFLVETAIVVAISGGFGMGLAFGMCALVNLLPMPPFFAGLMPPREVVMASFALLGLIAILSALYPARKAASIDPIEALRYEAGG